MKKSFILFTFSLLFTLSGCAELGQIASQMPGAMGGMGGIGNVSNSTIGNGLKQALQFGVQEGVQNLGKRDGFFGNSLTRILLPQELQDVDRALRNIGLGSLADEGLKILNRAAEDAVTEAAPIFVNAITSMTINDAAGILLGPNNAATTYLENRTSQQLFTAFKPKVQNSLGKVGADQIWNQIITQYNNITGQRVNPDLNSYVTEQTINGVFKMVAQKELGIRGNVSQRTTPLLKEVFALQDGKR